jgi:hypothetical protein
MHTFTKLPRLVVLLAAAGILAAVPLAGAAPRHAAATTTFGQQQVGSLVDWGGPNWLDVSGPYAVSSAVSVSKLSAYVAGGSAVSHVRGVIYADSSGKPGAFMGVTPEATIAANQAAGWIDLTFASAVALPAGSYWLGYWYADYNSRHFYVNVAGSERYSPATYSATGNPPAAFPAGGTSASSYSLYATYTTGTSGGAPVNTGLPVISSSESFPNYTLSVTQGTWTNSPTSFSYKWCFGPSDAVCSPVNNPVSTSSTLALQWPVIAGYVVVDVTATNAAGSTTVETGKGFAPSEFTVVDLPTIVVDGGGAPRVGSNLEATDGGYLGLSTGAPSEAYWTFQFTWLRCDAHGANCVPSVGGPGGVSGSKGPPYVVTAADVGSTIRVLDWSDQVSGTSRRIVVASAPTAVVTP